jgi:hypothetical protein
MLRIPPHTFSVNRLKLPIHSSDYMKTGTYRLHMTFIRCTYMQCGLNRAHTTKTQGDYTVLSMVGLTGQNFFSRVNTSKNTTQNLI